MMDGNEHRDRVDAWLRRAPDELSPEQHLRRFELTFGAILLRAHQTLGEVTLIAIADRVFSVASEQFPVVSDLEVEATCIRRRQPLRPHHLQHDQVVLATRFVLVEFLTVLGNLTAEILTPALHGELAREIDDAVAEDCSCHARKESEGVEP